MRPEKPCLRAKKYFIAALGVTLVCATSAWAAREKILHNFVNLPHGANPQANVIAVSAGNLYGTTYNGGEHGFGAVFALSQGTDGMWTERVLYSFLGSTDGGYPTGGLILDSAGSLYGTTTYGGYFNDSSCNGGCGVVFKLTPVSGGKWLETVLYGFRGSGNSNGDGSSPFCASVVKMVFVCQSSD